MSGRQNMPKRSRSTFEARRRAMTYVRKLEADLRVARKLLERPSALDEETQVLAGYSQALQIQRDAKRLETVLVVVRSGVEP